MLEDIPIKMSGAVLIHCIEGSKQTLMFDGHNAILPTAQRVIAHNAANQPSTFIDTMEVWDGLIMKASINNVVATVDALPGGPYKSIFQGLFDLLSFSGDFDKVVLKSSGVDNFSELILLSPITKLPTQQISIQWKISFT